MGAIVNLIKRLKVHAVRHQNPICVGRRQPSMALALCFPTKDIEGYDLKQTLPISNHTMNYSKGYSSYRLLQLPA
jgi:hypothetical protein